METHGSQRIILAFDGSDAALNRILQNVRLTQWREDQLILVAIVPRPVELFCYEPQWFAKTISFEEFHSLRARLQRCVEQLVADGYKANLQLMHGDDPHGVSASLMDLNPGLVVTPRATRAMGLLSRFGLSTTSFLINALACPVLVV